MLLTAATPPEVQLSPRGVWMRDRDKTETTFNVPADKGDQAWSRAKAWIVRCSDFRLQTIDTELLETYNPPDERKVRMAFSLSREQLGGGVWRFAVRAYSGNPCADRLVKEAAQDLALYVQTGVDCPECPCGKGGGENNIWNSLDESDRTLAELSYWPEDPPGQRCH
jgi:hypothetical protein